MNETTLADLEEPKVTGKFPKREKKKAETRKKIIAASIDLFLEGGTDDITLEEVAEHAGVHVQTLYRHFPNKVSLMLAGDNYWLDKFERYLADAPAQEDTFRRWKSWHQYAYKDFLEDTAKYKSLYSRKISSPVGLAGLSAVQLQYENLLCHSLAKDFDMSPDGIGIPRLVAGMLVAGNANVIRRFISQDIDFMAETIETVTLVESMFAHLIVKRARANIPT